MRFGITLVSLVMAAAAWSAQGSDRLLNRWVGTYEGQPLHLDFYADTMLLLNDSMPLWFSVDGDSLTAWGDTTFTVHYWFALDRLLILTAESKVVTMAPQDRAARPIWGDWRGSPIGRNDRVELELRRGGVARYRILPGGGWHGGEWNRTARIISFVWQPDSTEWEARFDPEGAALLFDSAYAASGTVVLRKVYR